MVTYEEFVVENTTALLRFAVALTADHGLAEELVQDTLVKAFRSWDRISGLDQPWSYVRRMLVNEHVSWRRKWARHVPVAQVSLTDHADSDAIDRIANRDAVLGYLRQLPARQRAAVVLRYLEDMSVEQIAHVLGCRPTSVRAYLSKAMATLRANSTTPVLMEGPAR